MSCSDTGRKSVLSLLISVIFILMFASFSYSIDMDTNNIVVTTNDSDSPGDFIEEIEEDDKEQTGNIIFDNYDEVMIKNYDDEGISEIHFIGNVSIRFDENQLDARKVIVTIKGDQVLEIAAFENVEFHYGTDIYLSDTLVFDPDKTRGVMRNVRSYMADSGGSGMMSSSTGWYYSAAKATILDENKVVLVDVVMTTSDEKHAHYSFQAGRVWYYQNEVVYALGVTYTVAQADFFWFPFFFQWQKGSGITTAFGREMYLGWYMMNTMELELPVADMDIQFDIYERIGEYLRLELDDIKFSELGLSDGTNDTFDDLFDIDIQLADDVRIFGNNSYNQFQYDNDNAFGDPYVMRQFSWYYDLSGSVPFETMGIGDFNFSFNWVDLNDPFFKGKYTTRYGAEEGFDVADVLQPENNDFYTYGGDAYRTTTSYSRSFTVSSGIFNMTGTLNYKIKENEEVTNKYLNEHYDYYKSSVDFPNITFNPSSISLISDFSYSKHQDIELSISNTNFTLAMDEDIQDYIDLFKPIPFEILTNIEYLSNVSITNVLDDITNIYLTNLESYTFSTNYLTNDLELTELTNEMLTNTEPVSELTNETTNETIDLTEIIVTEDGETNESDLTNVTELAEEDVEEEEEIIYTVTTNDFVFYSFSSSIDPDFSFTSTENFDTNEELSSDTFTHKESAALNLNGDFLSDLLYWNNSFTFNNFKKWTTFESENENYAKASGYTAYLSSGIGMSEQTGKLFADKLMEIKFPFKITYTYKHDLENTKREGVNLREAKHATGITTGFNMLDNEVDFDLSLTHDQTVRLTNDTDVEDEYLNNITKNYFSLATSFDFYWLTMSSSFNLNALEYKTNDGYIWDHDELTNRIMSEGIPKLSASLSTPGSSSIDWIDMPIPTFTVSYSYDIFNKTNESVNISSAFSLDNVTVPLIYEITSMDFSSSVKWNFLTPRESLFSLSFSTTIMFTQFWELQFSTSVQNNKLYLYTDEIQPYFLSGDIPVDFWTDLGDSLKIWDVEALKRTNFKMQGLNFDLIHYLDEWELHIQFNVDRKVNDTLRIAYWEPKLEVKFELSGSDDQFPPYEQSFVPEELRTGF